MTEDKNQPKPEGEPPYERSDFFRDLSKVSRKLGPDETEKKKAKGRRRGGRLPKTT
jgi:hypothetical protein